jgi:UDP-N-acetylbacillosamine N-acetyltransferase
MVHRPRIVIWGAGGHALVVADLVRASGHYTLAGYLVDAENSGYMRESLRSFVLGGSEKLDALLEDGVREVVVAIGDCKTRLAVAARLTARGFTLATLVHPGAIVAPDANLGAGTVIAAGAVVGTQALVGENVILNTNASIDHECRIADGAHISPGAHLAGQVTVGRASWVGIGASVIDGITIGANSVVGAGAVVIRDIRDNVLACGVPAKVIREVK